MQSGGVSLYINNRLCNNIKVQCKLCTRDLEMLNLSLHTYCLPTVAAICVSISPRANKKAVELLAKDVNTMLAECPEAPLSILGDFINSRLDIVLPSFKQYVDIPIKMNRNTARG